ncbi:DMT family transporter [Leptotrichia sp. oral taxon 218]|nr:DMT family transporter [Leptotrichia sp. oral taxon 218]
MFLKILEPCDFSRGRFSCSIICIIGIGVISFDKNLNLSDINFGDILTIISAVFFAFQIATTGFFSRKVEPLKLIFLQMIFAGILFVVNFFIFSNPKEISDLKGMALISVGYLTIFSTIVPTLLQTVCQKFTTSTRASLLMSTESLFAPIFAFFLLGEILSLKVIIGAGIVLFSIVLSEI